MLVGLIGSGIQASLTPALHEAEGAAQGLRYTYRLIDLNRLRLSPAALPELLTKAEAEGFTGLNITHPCKQAVIPHLHELSPEAAAIGAVNTVLLGKGRRIGHNTDWLGFAEACKRDLPDAPRSRVVQLGAGGAGAAVANALLTLGVQNLLIIDVDHRKATQLADALRARFSSASVSAAPGPDEVIETADGLVNATPIGMARHPGLPLPAHLLRPTLWIADVIYYPRETELLRCARSLGCRTMDGGGMAVFQAVEAFRLFTGRAADAARMQRHFEALSAPRA